MSTSEDRIDEFNKRLLLAFIQLKHSSDVFIDIVEISKKGSSYHYNGTVWHRDPCSMGGGCTDPQGNSCKIVPLSRTHAPGWAEQAVYTIKDQAKERYELWINKKIKS